MSVATHPRAPYRKRYARKANPARIDLTERDIEMIRAVARLRFASSLQLWRMAGGSLQKVRRRLELLYDHAFLDRPSSQIVQLFADGNKPTVYGLGRAGATFIAEHDGIPLNRLDWTTKNKRAGGEFIAHTIETAEVMISIALAARNRELRLVDHAELLPYFPEKTRKQRNPFYWKVKVKAATTSENVGLVPDRVFSLFFPDNTRLNFALEYDRGTMPIHRHEGARQTSFARKLAAYWQGWQDNKHEQLWGFRQLFILTVAPSRERLDHMIEAQKTITGTGSRLFLFTTPELLLANGPLTATWINGKNETVSLVS